MKPASFLSFSREWALPTLALLASSLPAQAAVRNWDGDTSATWATAANWDTLPANDFTATGDIARFNLAVYGGNPVFAPNAGTTSILGVEIGGSNGAMTMGSTNLSVGASGITMELGAAATTIGKITAAVDQTWTNNSGNILSVNVANVLTGRVTLAGTGTIAFGTANTGAGGVKIAGATVTAANSQQFGTGLLELNSGTFVVNANRSFANDLSITGNFTFNTASTGPGFTSATKSTTGNVVLTFQPLVTATANTGVGLTGGTLVLGGNLEFLATAGGDNGLRTINRNFTSGISTGGATRTLTFSETAGSGTTTIGLLTLNANLIIAGAGGTTVTLNGGFDTGGAARTITFNNNGAGIPTLSGPLTGTASTVTIAGSSTNARIGALTGSAHAIEVNSTTGGSFLFNGASTYSGGTTITSGIAVVSTTAGVAGTSGPLGTGALVINGGRLESTFASDLLGSSAVTVNGGELRAIGANTLVTNAIPITLNGGTLRGFNAATTNYGGGAINVTANSSIVNERSGAASNTSMNLTFGTSVAVGNAQLNVTSTDNQTGGTSTITAGAGTLTGNGILNVTKNPSATNSTVLALTSLGVTGSSNAVAAGNGAVTVSGATTIGGGSAGSLAVHGTLNATGGLSVAANGTLSGSGGTITGAVTTASSSSIIAPGSSAGTLTLSNTLDATAGANFKFELGATSGSPDSDRLTIGGVFTGSSAVGGLVFNFSNVGAGTTASLPYTLMTFASSTGFERTDISTSILPSGYTLDTTFGDNGYALNSNNLQVQFSAIPEPGTAALLIGAASLLALRRRPRA